MQATHNASNCTIVLEYYWKGTCISDMRSKPGEEDVRDAVKSAAVKWMVDDLRSGKTKEEIIATYRSTIDGLERRALPIASSIPWGSDRCHGDTRNEGEAPSQPVQLH